jgi:DNA mismatch repair protein MutL
MGQDSLFKLSKENNAERPVFQLHRQYILSPVKSGLLLIHQTGAYERILYDKYKKQLVAPKNITQQLLFPIDIKLNASDFQLILEIEPEIRNLGFVFVVVEAQHLQLKGVPVGIHHENHLEIFEEFIEQFKNYQSNLEVTKLEMMARALAKRTAARMRVSLSGQEMNQLIDQLFASENPNYTPEGKAIFRSLSLHELDNLLATQN